ncbi:hypothetical protein MPL3356_270028 [Mesorhizobium plurifarium]|uniref:Di-haem cytochrome c peroxidase domain-containing protein n=1 Tax=Mesorhizobium plurifarium TaxID=69974 RepID=A0A090DU92_MESPL|nr:hypothetical protein MPL3356_270028 [Mesorhizobium plurifarium]
MLLAQWRVDGGKPGVAIQSSVRAFGGNLARGGNEPPRAVFVKGVESDDVAERDVAGFRRGQQLGEGCDRSVHVPIGNEQHQRAQGKQCRWRTLPSIDFGLPLAEIDAAVCCDEGAKRDCGLVVRPELGAVEMGITPDEAVVQLKGIPGYVDAFDKAFPADSDPVTYDNEQAFAVFEATLITPNAPFVRYLEGDENALTAKQKEGLALFIDKGNRYATTAEISAMACMLSLAWLRARSAIAAAGGQGAGRGYQNPDDEYVFRSPALLRLLVFKAVACGTSSKRSR